MGGQRVQRRTGRGRPPGEVPARKSFEAQPEALPIIDEQLQCGASSVAKQEHSSRERVTVEAITAQRGERINTFAKIDWLISKHDLELWGKLDHGLGAKKS